MKVYEKYRSSEVDWVDKIPAHWSKTKLKYIGFLYSGLSGLNGNDFKQEGNPNNKPYIPFTNIANNFRINTKHLEYFVLKESDTQNKVLKNDLFFMMSSENFDDVGKSTILTEDIGEVYLNSFCKGFRVTKNHVNPLFLNYLLLNYPYRCRMMIEANGFTRINLKMEGVNDFVIEYPPLKEQIVIANYLEDKTKKIDTLIEKKKELVELLKEKRTASINEIVTKGINSNAKLKSSGIDWLGNLPEHWTIKKLKYVGNIRYGLGQPPKLKEDGLPLIRATNVERGKINEKDLIFVDPDDVPYERDPILRENDIIVVRSGAYTADSAIIPKKFEGAITGYDMVIRVPNDNPQFLAYCLLSDYVLISQLYLNRLRAAQPHLNKEELGETVLLMPPKKEQDLIVDTLKSEIDKIESTISKTSNEIGFLSEYRSALINEVVTGKVKVE